MYELSDQGWRAQPRRMSERTVDRVAERIAEHARRHALRELELVLHGGEPLLAGAGLIRRAVLGVRGAVGDGVTVTARVQTNGVLLDDAMLSLLGELDVRIGVSLDGGPQEHNRHRVRANGRGSHAEVTAGLWRLRDRRFRRLFSGLLCTIDLRNDPVATYEALIVHAPPVVDFLLPHGNWDDRPPGRGRGPDTPYADWLIAVFERWYSAPAVETRVRLFSEIIGLLLGGRSGTEAVGLSPVALAVVETDGSVEQVDSLKSAFAGAAGTALHVEKDSFDAALEHPGIRARQAGIASLSTECRACPIVRICGGGLYAHRFGKGNGFANPSVYCRDLERLIRHIDGVLQKDLSRLPKAIR
ncbi:hypothetical protein GCM10009727_19620 [Actinomadura napierensis]|uniref:Radical SAM core domain-containing protein n=2 Tax=Actinomadura napierensis TaxID=267854 RepID=A0ABN2YKT5_9ACTN